MKLFQLIGTLIMFLSCAENTEKKNLTLVENYLKTIEKEKKIIGSVSIFKSGNEIYQKNISYKNETIQKETLFRIGSISKTYTAVLVMQLIDEDKLSLENTLEDYFPEIPNASNISIHQLLQHRSGIFNLTDDENLRNKLHQDLSKKEILNAIKNGSVQHEPCIKVSYSNSNYILLSYILESIEKKSFGEIIEQRITKPTQLANTLFADNDIIFQKEAKPYSSITMQWEEIEYSKLTNLLNTMGAGGLVSNAKDINKFYHALFEGKLTSKESLDQMKNTIDNMGLGLGKTEYQNKEVFGHDGEIDSYKSFVLYLPDNEVSISITTSASKISVKNLVFELLTILYPGEKNNIISKKEVVNFLKAYGSEQFPKDVQFKIIRDNFVAQVPGEITLILKKQFPNNFIIEKQNMEINFQPNGESFILDYKNEKYLFKQSIANLVKSIVKSKSEANLIDLYLKAKQEGKYHLDENQLNNLGYEFLENSYYKEAINIFKLNVFAYPERYNPYDSLGEAYMASGDIKNAIINYEKSVELNPKNESGKKILVKLKKKI